MLFGIPKEKLDKLQKIAKSEEKDIKVLLNEMIDDFIDANVLEL